MEKSLAGQDWLLGAGPSVANVSLYAYTHVANQGGFDLAAYPGVRAWIDRVPALKGYAPFAGRLKDSDDRRAPSTKVKNKTLGTNVHKYSHCQPRRNRHPHPPDLPTPGQPAPRPITPPHPR